MHIINYEICVSHSSIACLMLIAYGPKRRIPAVCVTYSHLSDDKCLCQNVGLGNATQHGRRSVGGREDHVPPLFSLRGQHRECPPTFSLHKNKLQAYSEG